MTSPRRIAMWSGPRNISTAMMRSWGSRADTVVLDEPFYAVYLDRTDVAHPGRDEVLARHERDPRRVIESLLAPLPEGVTVHYQKQMTHHMLPSIDRSWLPRVTSCFLIRDPADMITSYVKLVPEPTLRDLGLREQAEIFEQVRELTGETPPVIDSRDVLLDPRGALTALCGRLGVPFDEAMLAWEPGRRDTDGVWAKHWYDRVEASSGFAPYRPKEETVPARLADLHARCREYYDALAAHRI
jgi:hypothetical protein